MQKKSDQRCDRRRKKMYGASVCSGIGGAEVAAPDIDWKWCSEIDAFPSAVLAQRFPNLPNFGDLTKRGVSARPSGC